MNDGQCMASGFKASLAVLTVAIACVITAFAAGCQGGTSSQVGSSPDGSSGPGAIPRVTPIPRSDDRAGLPPNDRAGLPPVDPDPNRYAGSSACTSCHAVEAQQWSHSRHSQTLREAVPRGLGTVSPPPGRIPGTDIEVGIDPATSHFGVHPVGNSRESYPLTLALGSGKSGVTYVEVAGPQVLEFRKSYFVPQHTWYTTPGIEAIPQDAFFSGHTPETSRECIGCHSSAPGRDGLVPDQRFFGVGCESCHGPGKAHADAARAGHEGTARMPSLPTLSATQINDLCGRCHRTGTDLRLAGADSAATNRFAPYGLMLSRCFEESGRSLSCVTCHNPHSNASTETKTYEAACLSCHSGGNPSRTDVKLAPESERGKVCPVNATSGCISCHMPRRKAFPGTPLPITMPDHWIRIYKRQGP